MKDIVEQIVDMPVSLTYPFDELQVDVTLPQTIENSVEQIVDMPVSLTYPFDGSVGLPVPPMGDMSGSDSDPAPVLEVRRSIVPRNTGRRQLISEPVPIKWEGLAMVMAVLFSP
eukprot:2321627-Amphidinium_carterae.1